MVWPLELREACIRRLLGPNPPMVRDLALETGIPPGTLSRWQCKARREGWGYSPSDMAKKARRPQDWTPEQKLRAVVESAGLSDDELGEFLRREGLHAHVLEQWRQDALAGLGTKARNRRPVSRRERQLERELRRKEKALAEAAALLVLEKKSRELFEGDEDDSSKGR